VLENCSKVLEYFVGDAKSIRSRCLTARDTLVDKLVDRYRHAMTSFFEEVLEIFIQMLREAVVQLYMCTDICDSCHRSREDKKTKTRSRSPFIYLVINTYIHIQCFTGNYNTVILLHYYY